MKSSRLWLPANEATVAGSKTPRVVLVSLLAIIVVAGPLIVASWFTLCPPVWEP